MGVESRTRNRVVEGTNELLNRQSSKLGGRDWSNWKSGTGSGSAGSKLGVSGATRYEIFRQVHQNTV